jgi:hypothetical protein
MCPPAHYFSFVFSCHEHLEITSKLIVKAIISSIGPEVRHFLLIDDFCVAFLGGTSCRPPLRLGP